MRDLHYLRTVQQALAAARDETRGAVARGSTPEGAVDSVLLEPWRASLACQEKWLNTLFHQFFRAPVVRRLYHEARSGPLE